MGKNVISRRKFLGRTTAGIGLGLIGQSASISAQGLKSTRDIEKLRREVKVASVDLQHLYPEKSISARIKKILSRMENVSAYQPDIICLPETFSTSMVSERTQFSEIAEDENTTGPITSRIGEFAKKHNCYVICPMVTTNEGKFYNSAILLDREGRISGVFHKTRPVSTEIMEGKGIVPGPVRPPVFKTDFGKIGMQICFDANWFESWAYLKDDGAEIVFFPSQFPGGRMLSFHAWKNNYYIVSSTSEDARIIDISGIDLDSSSFQLGYTWASINLEKEYIPTFPGKSRIPDIFRKYGDAVKIKVYRDTGGGAGTGAGHITIESLDPDLKVRNILQEFEIPTYREELKAAREVQEKYRL